MRKRELNLIRRAIREHWPVTTDMRNYLVLQLENEVLTNLDARARIAAARALMMAVGSNTAQAKLALELLKFTEDQDQEERVKALEEVVRAITGQPSQPAGEDPALSPEPAEGTRPPPLPQ